MSREDGYSLHSTSSRSKQILGHQEATQKLSSPLCCSRESFTIVDNLDPQHKD